MMVNASTTPARESQQGRPAEEFPGPLQEDTPVIDEDACNGESCSYEPASPSGSDLWMPVNDQMVRADRLLRDGMRPLEVLNLLFPYFNGSSTRWNDKIAISVLSQLLDTRPMKRIKLPQYSTFEDALQLFRNCKKILVLSGAGVSVSCGIPDFRSKDGIYSRLHESFPDLPDPQAMFDLQYFKKNPKPFYEFAKEIYPGNFTPSFCHLFIRELEKKDKLLRNYTQNIDTLERVCGLERVIECHGSFEHSFDRSHLTPDYGFDITDLLLAGLKRILTTNLSQKDSPRQDLWARQQQQHGFDLPACERALVLQEVAYCPSCSEGVIKPDIVFFGESLAKEFHQQMAADKHHVDLLVVIGSSLKVAPVSQIPFATPPNVPQILINREPLSHYTPDIELLGNCDDVLREIALRLGDEWAEFARQGAEQESTRLRRCVPLEEYQQILSERLKKDEEEEEADASDEKESSEKAGCSKEEGTRTHVEQKAESPTKEENETSLQGTSSSTEIKGSSLQEVDVVPPKGEIGFSPQGEKRSLPRETETEGAPQAKKVCLSSLYQPNFVSVESLLPKKSFFMVASNRYVFPGAEIYYNLDSGVYVVAPHHHHGQTRMSSPSSNSEEPADSGDNYEGEEECSTRSEDNIVYSSAEQDEDEEDTQPRSASCDASFDLTLLPSSGFLDSLLAEEEEEWKLPISPSESRE